MSIILVVCFSREIITITTIYIMIVQVVCYTSSEVAKQIVLVMKVTESDILIL